MRRTTFLIDGFNLYHSLKHAGKDLRNRHQDDKTRWLNLHGLCTSYLHAIGNRAQLEEIYYFSALAVHLEAGNPNVTQRHKDYITCLEDSGIIVELNRFKPKEINCPNCRNTFVRHEEKETDVSISVKLIEVCLLNKCDTAVLVTGDTDIALAVRTVKRLCKDKKIHFLFPYKRHNRELELIADGCFDINVKKIYKHQFPDPYICRNGMPVNKPAKW